MGGPPPAITSNQNNFLWPVAACWAPGASVEVFLRLGVHFGVPPVRGQWAYYRKYAPEDVFQELHSQKLSRHEVVGVGLHEVASPRARAAMRRTAFSADLKRRPTQADTGSSTCTARRLCSRGRQHGHDDDHHHHNHTTTTTTDEREDCGSSEQSESESDADNEIQFV